VGDGTLALEFARAVKDADEILDEWGESMGQSFSRSKVDDIFQFVSEAQTKAWCILRRPKLWRAVVAIAQALIDRKGLTGAEAKALYTAAEESE